MWEILRHPILKSSNIVGQIHYTDCLIALYNPNGKLKHFLLRKRKNLKWTSKRGFVINQTSMEDVCDLSHLLQSEHNAKEQLEKSLSEMDSTLEIETRRLQ